MTRLFYFSIFYFIVFSSCGNAPVVKKEGATSSTTQIPQVKIDPLKSGLKNGILISKIGKTSYDDLYGAAGDSIYYSTYKGTIECADTLTRIKHEIIKMNVLFLLDKLYLVPLNNNKWFLFWEETDYDGIKSYAAVYETNGKKAVWKVGFLNPNPSMPVVDGNYAYIANLGMAAKISLLDGKIVWKQDSLFNQFTHAYQDISKPMVYDDKVIFLNLRPKGRMGPSDSLIVDPISGVRKK